WLYNRGIPRIVVLYGKENDDEEADRSCCGLFICASNLLARKCFESQFGEKCDHLREAGRADLSEALRGVPPRRRNGADVAGELRRDAALGARDQGKGRRPRDAAFPRGWGRGPLPEGPAPDR